MNERIKKLAEQAGCYQETDHDGKLFWAMPEDSWEKFAELVRADEREACAKVCEKELHNITVLTSMPLQSSAAWTILQKIKARGEVK